MNAKLTLQLLRQAGMQASPHVALVTGSGISLPFRVVAEVPYESIPGMVAPSVAGHKGRFQVVDVQGIPVLICSGRLHRYEGFEASQLLVMYRLLAELGITHLILTNAVGSLTPSIPVGSIVLVDDVIRPLAYQYLTPTLPHLHDPMELDREWIVRTHWQARQTSLLLHRGIYVQVHGPQYETQAEIRMFRIIGAQIIGMSSAIEAMESVALGLHVQILSLVTNALQDVGTPSLTHDHVLSAASNAQDNVVRACTSAIFAACQ